MRALSLSLASTESRQIAAARRCCLLYSKEEVCKQIKNKRGELLYAKRELCRLLTGGELKRS